MAEGKGLASNLIHIKSLTLNYFLAQCTPLALQASHVVMPSGESGILLISSK